MSKKAGTQIIEALTTAPVVTFIGDARYLAVEPGNGVPEMDTRYTVIPETEAKRLIRLAKAVNKRDEEYRVGKNPNAKRPAKATRRR
jgi:hypothetical protein